MQLLQMKDVELSGKRVLIRVDLNVPIENGKIMSTKRIEAVLPTVTAALAQQARVILMSHLGRPKEGDGDSNLSLKPVAECLSELLGQEVKFIAHHQDDFQLEPGQVALLENVRFLEGEKANSANLGKQLANLCDVFVMDAFATAHRKEASTYSVAEHAKLACAGPLLMSEIHAIQQIMKNPARPLVAIVGGSKVSTKLLILKKILNLVDYLIVGGGIANTFLAAKGYSIGSSLYEKELIPEAQTMLALAEKTGKQILLPLDVIVATEFSKEAKATTKSLEAIAQNEMILDVGPKACDLMASILSKAKTILWNGPVGVFEWDQFANGTKSLANAIVHSQAFSLAGGGDTLAAIEKYGISTQVSYISTGGGAFLEFIEGKSLPAISVLERRYENALALN